MRLPDLYSDAKKRDLSAPLLQPARALYVHIPFCERRCHYCDFYSMVGSPEKRAAFERALLRELRSLIREVPDIKLDSVYFGGGTPSLLTLETLDTFFSLLHQAGALSEASEVTLEANPSSMTYAKALAYKKMGINRLSLGLQTSDDQILRYLGRLHTKASFLEALNDALRAGIPRLSTDFITGLPGQTEALFQKDLDFLMALPVDHFSAYSLILAEDTLFWRTYVEGDNVLGLPPLPSEELERDFYHKLCRRAKAEGYVHYEISNWGRNGDVSRHNLTYWRLEPYYALGPAAVAFLAGERQRRAHTLKDYLLTWDGEGPIPPYLTDVIVEETLDRRTEKGDFMLLGFRIRDGVSEHVYRERFGVPLETDFGKELKELSADGLITKVHDLWRLTDRGLDFANVVFRAFIL